MKNPSPTPDPVGPKPETSESSVVFSLAELANLQRERLDEAARDDAAKRESERLATAKAKEDEARRVAEEAERRARAETMRRLDEAAIEASKNAEIDRRAMEQRHRHELARLQAESAHAREMAKLAETKRPRGVSTSSIAAMLSVVAALVVGALVWALVVMPKRQDEALRQLSRQEQNAAAEHASIDAAHQKALDDLHHQLDVLGEKVKLAATKPEPTVTTKPKTPIVHAPPTATATTSGGCDFEVAGVPMCAKAPPK